MSDDKFKGASFNADFVLSRETMDEMVRIQPKIEVFRKVVEQALDRVKNDLVTQMKLKDPETFIREISDEEIDKFLKHGIKITITGEVRE